MGSKVFAKPSRETALIHVPLSHSYGFTWSLTLLCQGETVVILPRFELTECLQAISTYKVNYSDIPAIYLWFKCMLKANSYILVAHTFGYTHFAPQHFAPHTFWPHNLRPHTLRPTFYAPVFCALTLCAPVLNLRLINFVPTPCALKKCCTLCTVTACI